MLYSPNKPHVYEDHEDTVYDSVDAETVRVVHHQNSAVNALLVVHDLHCQADHANYADAL